MKKMIIGALCLIGLMTTAKADRIDIMMLYTKPAQDYSGNMGTKINNLISYANRTFRNNAVDINLRVVAQGKITNTNRVPSGSDLDWLTNNSSIKGYRSQYRADMVALLGKRQNVSGGYVCGIAWVGQGSNGRMYSSSKARAYSISAVDCGNNTFVHELGHNMGLAHSRRQGDTSGGVYRYGMGHGVDYSFSTIMAYPQAYNGNVSHLDIFSDPNWNACNSQPCGVSGVSDAYRALGPIIDDIAGYY